MPKRTDIHSILIIGAGPIIIGQACEFDYSGAQACKALRAEGYRVVLVNSNPATIMTDPEPRRRHLCRADHPRDRRERIIEKRAPRRDPAHHGRADRSQHRDSKLFHDGRSAGEATASTMIGARCRGDRQAPRTVSSSAMRWTEIGHRRARARAMAHTLDEAFVVLERTSGCPRSSGPRFTLGGTGGGVAYNREEFDRASCSGGLDASPTDRGADRGDRSSVGRNMRWRWCAISNGQLHHHLLDRECRPNGGAYRRQRSPSRRR